MIKRQLAEKDLDQLLFVRLCLIIKCTNHKKCSYYVKRPNLVEIKRFVYENQDICVNQSKKTELKGIYESVISSDSRWQSGIHNSTIETFICPKKRKILSFFKVKKS